MVVVNWNGGRELALCVESLLSQRLEGQGLEVLVVDNGSTDGSADFVEARFPRVKVVRNGRNLGYARAANIGIRASGGEFVLLLNPDTHLLPGALSALVSFAASHPSAGAIGPKLLSPDGSVQPSCRRFPPIGATLLRHTFLESLFPKHPLLKRYLMLDFDHKRAAEVDWVSGACMLLRREAVKQVGGFDERFFLYSEDVDLCLRLKRAGWKVYYVPEAEALHLGGHASERRPFFSLYHAHRSMWLFFRAHHRGTGMWWLGPAVLLGLMARFFVVLATSAARRLLPGWRARRGRYAGPV